MELLLEKLRAIKFPKNIRKNISPIEYEYMLFGETWHLRGRKVCKKNEEYAEVYKLLKEIIKEYDDKFEYTSIIINKNKKSMIHKDKNNIFKSYIFAVGNYKGGELMIENWKTGKITKNNIKNKILKFDGCKNNHWVNDFTGERYSIVYYSLYRLIIQTIEVDGYYIKHRNRTSDVSCINQVIKRKVYLKRGIKFNKEQVWLDLGANIGTFTIMAGKNCKKVYSYEFEFNNFNFLKHNIKINKLKNVKALKCMVNENPRVVYYRPRTDFNKYQYSIKPDSKYWEKLKLKPNNVSTFNKVMEKHKDINCIKMDIEGSEMEILENFKYHNKIDILIFEWSFRKDKSIKRFYNVIDKLVKHYKIKHNKVNREEEEYNYYSEIVYCVKNGST
jgi:FkbM family methyltransferase